MTLRAVVKGCGHYLPERVVENAEFEKTLETDDAWIRARSGIERRHFAAADLSLGGHDGAGGIGHAPRLCL